MAVTLKQVEAFHVVMTAGGITRAAETLGVSQPAISRMIADLEETVGFPLFLRASRNVVPTERARALHREVERTFLGLGHIETVIKSLRERGESKLRLAIVPSLVPLFTDLILADFVAEHPDAAIALEVQPSMHTLDWLATRHCDLGITTDPIGGPGLDVRIIGRTEAVCVLPADHPLAMVDRPLAPADLEGALFVSYMPDSAFRIEIDRRFASAGVSRRLRFEARTTAAVCELAAALGGIAIVPGPGPRPGTHPSLRMLPFRPSLISDVVLVRPEGWLLSTLGRAFAEFVEGRRIEFRSTIPTDEIGRSMIA